MLCLPDAWDAQTPELFPVKLVLGGDALRVDALSLLHNCDIFKDCEGLLKPEARIPIVCNVTAEDLRVAVGVWYQKPLPHLTFARATALAELSDYLRCGALAQLIVVQCLVDGSLSMHHIWTIFRTSTALVGELRRAWTELHAGMAQQATTSPPNHDPFGDFAAFLTLPLEGAVAHWTGMDWAAFSSLPH